MEYKNFFALLGGLALFLYGMHQMSEGLNAAAGEKMKQILERLTKNRFLGVGIGAAVTAVIQSSSATTVMVVGFVNSGMMTLRQAVWIIMGANIGTTITGQLIALDAGAVAPLLAFFGVVLILFAGKDRIRYTGEIVAGLGILFIGMDMMGEAMQPLCDSQVFLQAMTKFEHPLLGILAGAAFTAAIQSSSASVGILQTLAQGGAVSFAGAVYVLFGQNIGTCGGSCCHRHRKKRQAHHDHSSFVQSDRNGGVYRAVHDNAARFAGCAADAGTAGCPDCQHAYDF